MTDQQDEYIEHDETDVESTATSVEDPPQYGVGPFSIRETALAGVWLAAFVVSFFPLGAVRIDASAAVLLGFGSVWQSGLGWILPVGLPTIAVFLLILRRLSPDGIRRFGSLGIDQFASVAFSISAIIWLQIVWETVAFVISGGVWLRSWVIWVEVALMIVGVLLTVFAPFIAPFDEDFRGRREIPAHRNARPVRAVSPRPAPEPRPETPEAEDQNSTGASAPISDPRASADLDDADATSTAAADEWSPEQTGDVFAADAVADDVDGSVEVDSSVAEGAPVRHQAFWALVPEERDVVDEAGVPMFRIGPTAWALVIEDHGDRFVVRHEDGRVGHLLDVDGVTRG